MKGKWTKLFPVGLLLFGICCTGVQAEELEAPQHVEPIVYTFDEADIAAATQTLVEEEAVFPVLKEENYEKWIDRVEWPWYGPHFYNKILDEGTDNDGINDFFIEPDGCSAVGLLSLWEEDSSGGWVETKVPAIIIHNGLYGLGPGEDGGLEALLEDADTIMDGLMAAYGAFQMDHPEVFWLNSALNFVVGDLDISYDESYDVTTARGSLYLVLEMEYEGEMYSFNQEKYTDTAALRKAIKDMDAQVTSILNEASALDTISKIEYFNEWLTLHNERNTYVHTEEEALALYETYPEAFESISALYGNTGKKAPVSGSHARAFKVLCDRAGIPCVLTSGILENEDATGLHLWNYVQLDGSWYAVDVVCNDPMGGASGAVSGLERDDYVLIGKNTEMAVGEEMLTFGESHKETNQLSEEEAGFTNGPELSDEAYAPVIDKIILTSSAYSFYPDYDESPTITAQVIKREGVTEEAKYTWYMKQSDGTLELLPGERSDSIVFPEISTGGIWTLVVKVTVGNNTRTAEIKIEAIKFNDIDEKSWYYKAIQWALERGITYGYSSDYFGVYDACTRAQVVTFMWRAAGCPEPENVEVQFEDVRETDYFYKAVQWAIANGITSGYSETVFGPNDLITRAQFVSFFWRENGRPVPELPETEDEDASAGQEVMKFADVSEDAYYYDAVYWAVEHNITAGYTDDTFVPDDAASRAVIVTMLWRADNNLT